MAAEPPHERATARETLIFYAKLVGFLAALTAFGFVIFALRRML